MDPVIDAAIAVIDERGVRNMTIRRISSRMGVNPTALSRTVTSRDQLLGDIADALVDDLLDSFDPRPVDMDWRRYLRRVAHSIRATALAHPQIFQLIATRPPATPWLRPPLRTVDWAEAFLDALHHCGFGKREAVATYRTFCRFLLGHLLLEVVALDAQVGPALEPTAWQPRSSDLSGRPRLASLQRELECELGSDQFDESLGRLLGRIGNGLRG